MPDFNSTVNKSRTRELTVKRVLFHWQLESYSDLQNTVTTGIVIMRSLELNANAKISTSFHVPNKAVYNCSVTMLLLFMLLVSTQQQYTMLDVFLNIA